MEGGSDLRSFLGALKPQLAFMLSLMEIAESGLNLCAFGRLPHTVMGSDLCSVSGEGKRRIWAEKCRNFFGLHLIHIGRIRLQGRIGGLKLRLDLIPRQGRLC